MTVRPYEPRDFPQIAKWAKDGYNTEYQEDQFPATGFIVDGVAAYFLYSTDSSICYLENLISNKYANPTLKHHAIEMIIEAILKEARAMGFKVAYATTDIPDVVFRACQHGALARTKQTLLTKLLTIDPS